MGRDMIFEDRRLFVRAGADAESSAAAASDVDEDEDVDGSGVEDLEGSRDSDACATALECRRE